MTKSREVRLQSGVRRCFIVDLLMQRKFCCVNLIGRIWGTRKTNQITFTHLDNGQHESESRSNTKGRYIHKIEDTWLLDFKQFSLVNKAEMVQVHFTLRLRDQRSMWMQDGYKVYMDSYMASNGPCFMVTWTMSKNDLLEAGLTQN